MDAILNSKAYKQTKLKKIIHNTNKGYRGSWLESSKIHLISFFKHVVLLFFIYYFQLSQSKILDLTEN